MQKEHQPGNFLSKNPLLKNQCNMVWHFCSFSQSKITLYGQPSNFQGLRVFLSSLTLPLQLLLSFTTAKPGSTSPLSTPQGANLSSALNNNQHLEFGSIWRRRLNCRIVNRLSYPLLHTCEQFAHFSLYNVPKNDINSQYYSNQRSYIATLEWFYSQFSSQVTLGS